MAHSILENSFRQNFRLWGYKEIRTPTIEFMEALAVGIGSELYDRMFKFQDQDGKIVALRAELTTPIARVAATKMVEAPEPIRLFYLANVFRYSKSYVEKLREFWQAGVELLGSSAPEADAEVIALLIGSLKKTGLRDVRVYLGHAGFLRALLDGLGLEEEKKSSLRETLSLRDSQQLEMVMSREGVPPKNREFLKAMMKCSLPRDAVALLRKVPSAKAKAQLQNLVDVIQALREYGLEKQVFLDFSLTRRIEYYTGVMFEASVPDLGLPLGGGGRYDQLIEKFTEAETPATGFAVEIDKCLEALEAQGTQTAASDDEILVVSKSRETAFQLAETVRESGRTASTGIGLNDEKKAIRYAELAGVRYVLFPKDDAGVVKVYDVKVRKFERRRLNEIIKKRGR